MFYMASTKISSEKTAAEIQMILGRNGAEKILMEYENGEVSAISFLIRMGPKEIPFRLPIRWQKCLKAMIKDKKTPTYYCNEEQAKRTAWRVILRWVQSQFALINTEMVELAEVMLPYAQTGENTLYEKIYNEGFKALPSPSEK